ncbi:hypothetical protein SLEP1_g10128 [Rubroshorea leprosula]|uniref:Uncharacterized protein n=1 Tax=Rubroshorea leprosula TaxID=152421 RepID=A0AAV5IGJ8_9ROSI|nr:hypothetical protein SLEP1_g10128 [Rubroshorea leprosula]
MLSNFSFPSQDEIVFSIKATRSCFTFCTIDFVCT